MNQIINLLLIAVIAVVVVDLSGFVDAVKAALARWLTRAGRPTAAENIRLKPFDCSLCVTFWAGLFWLICVDAVSLGTLAALCLVALSTTVIDNLLLLALDVAAAAFDKLQSLLRHE